MSYVNKRKGVINIEIFGCRGVVNWVNYGKHVINIKQIGWEVDWWGVSLTCIAASVSSDLLLIGNKLPLRNKIGM